MSSRNRAVASVPPRTSVVSSSRTGASSAVNPARSTMRPTTAGSPQHRIKNNEIAAAPSKKATDTKAPAPHHLITKKDLSSASKAGIKKSSTLTTSKPHWFGNKTPAPAKQKKEEMMVTSTGTDSSGIFSDSEGGDANKKVTTPVKKPAQTASRITAAVAKTTSKFVNRTLSATNSNNDQLLIAELRNQIVSLKAQQQDQIEQLKHELGEKFRNDMAVLLAEQEAQFQKQLEAREAAWGAELSTRLEEERAEFARRLAEREAETEAARTEERRTWQAQMDDLLKKANHLLADKERLEKNIRHEVDARVQATVQRYNELQKETMSLQAVFELRCQEVKSLRQELEKASIAAAEAPILRERTLSLANHVEGLEAQLDHKNNEERRLHAELAKLKLHCKEESARARLLSMEKEQLQYRLQQRSESDRMSPTKSNHSTPLLSSTTETPRLSRKALPRINLSPIIAENGRNEKAERDGNSCKSRSDGSSASSDADEVFTAPASGAEAPAPSSPTVRDFTEKNDSVSYVLDLGDEHSPTLPAGPASPWLARRNKLVRSASLRYPARHLH